MQGGKLCRILQLHGHIVGHRIGEVIEDGTAPPGLVQDRAGQIRVGAPPRLQVTEHGRTLPEVAAAATHLGTDEIAGTLALDVSPATWPVGMGVDFRGIIDLASGSITSNSGDQSDKVLPGPNDPARLEAPFDSPEFIAALEALELAEAMLPKFDLESFLEGHLTPVFFGSALKSVGVVDLLNAIAKWAPPPGKQYGLPDR